MPFWFKGVYKGQPALTKTFQNKLARAFCGSQVIRVKGIRFRSGLHWNSSCFALEIMFLRPKPQGVQSLNTYPYTLSEQEQEQERDAVEGLGLGFRV